MAASCDIATKPASKVVVVGAGRTGETILRRLAGDDRFTPFALDIDYYRIAALRVDGIDGAEGSGNDMSDLLRHLRDAVCVVCAAPGSVSSKVAQAAVQSGCHYVDLCEESPSRDILIGDGARPGQCFVPGCGLAPGLVPALVDEMIRNGPATADITAYVGVLPADKTNRLGYGNLWGIDGVLTEYTGHCLALEKGQLTLHEPLRDCEHVRVAGGDYEAFSTSGSIDELVRRYEGQIVGLRFKTLRYSGHLDYILFLLDDLRLGERLYMFRNLLLNGLEKVERDRVLVHIEDRDPSAPRSFTKVFDAVEGADGTVLSAVSDVSAKHVCAVIDIIVHCLAPLDGVLHHTDLRPDILSRSRHGAALLGSLPSVKDRVGHPRHGRKDPTVGHSQD
jgi:saccharopine dehydrogenase-like NADP-dependent oxidoreductase